MIAKKRNGNKRRRFALLGVLIILLAAGGGAYYYYTRQSASAVQAASATEESFNTATVRQGSLTLSAAGSGTLVAGESIDLRFPVDGTVGELNVKVGDVVTKGQALASLADTTDLQTSVKAAQIELSSAQLALKELQGSASASIATAQLALATAQKAVTDAKSEWVDETWMRCDQETTDLYYTRWIKAKEDLEALGDGDGDLNYYNNNILPAKNKEAQAYSTYQNCLKFTDYEVESSHANLTLAEADLTEAQATLDTLLANNGIDPDALATAENNVALAEAALKSAQKKLDAATLGATFDGTVMSVAGKVGDEVDSETVFITISDLVHPVVEFSVDETDVDKVNLDADVEVVFDALPDSVFVGKVTQVDPALQSLSGYQVLNGEATLDLSDVTLSGKLLPGMSASVEVISGKAENTLLVPVEALTDLGDGSYGVMVVGDDGKARLKIVEVGIMDATYVQVISGLSAGQTITTGAVETQ